MRAVDIISSKRDGRTLTGDEIRFFVEGVTAATWPDYQASALLMAILLRGMTAEETAALTEAIFDKVTGLGERDWVLDSVARVEAVLDPQRVTQAVVALADNAVHHTSDGMYLDFSPFGTVELPRLFLVRRGDGALGLDGFASSTAAVRSGRYEILPEGARA